MKLKRRELENKRNEVMSLINQAKDNLILRGNDEYDINILSEIGSYWLKAQNDLNKAAKIIDGFIKLCCIELI